MTIEEFNTVPFGAGLKMKYQGIVYEICSVDFQEKLIAYQLDVESEHFSWARCENCELVGDDIDV